MTKLSTAITGNIRHAIGFIIDTDREGSSMAGDVALNSALSATHAALVEVIGSTDLDDNILAGRLARALLSVGEIGASTNRREFRCMRAARDLRSILVTEEVTLSWYRDAARNRFIALARS